MRLWWKNMDLLIDTNIIIDILQDRKPFVQNSEAIVRMVQTKEVRGILAPHTITNLWYILRKTHTQEQRRRLLSALLVTFDVSPLDRQKLLNGLERTDFPDFEDCLQDECAASLCADYIITRNPEDFAKSKVRAITPEEFLKLQSA